MGGLARPNFSSERRIVVMIVVMILVMILVINLVMILVMITHPQQLWVTYYDS